MGEEGDDDMNYLGLWIKKMHKKKMVKLRRQPKEEKRKEGNCIAASL